jgi:hypothetical protein
MEMLSLVRSIEQGERTEFSQKFTEILTHVSEARTDAEIHDDVQWLLWNVALTDICVRIWTYESVRNNK